MAQLTNEEKELLKAFLQERTKNFQNPTGTIVAFGGIVESRPANCPAQDGEDPDYVKVPPGWLLCDGRTNLLEQDYPELLLAIEDVWGPSDFQRIKLPDLRGQFIRGVKDGTTVGTFQEDEIKSHNHSISGNQFKNHGTNDGGPFGAVDGANNGASNGAARVTENFGGGETRPKNASVHWIIKT